MSEHDARRDSIHRTVFRWPDGDTAAVEASETETVFDAADRSGVGLPVGCRTGACGTCVARLIDGSVQYRRPPRALKGRHVRDGFVLLCIAEPRADCRFDVGAAVQSSLVAGPWRTG